MNKAFELDGRLVLITGGGTGLGLGMAKAIAASGGRVVITGRTEATLKAACGDIGDAAHYIVNDVREKAALPALLDEIEGKYGPLFGLISNAGVHLKKPMLETADDELLRVIDTHVLSGFALSRECARRMTARRDGSIIFICSMSAIFGLSGTPAYTAAKSALKGLTRELAVEFSPYNVRVNCIAPGFIESQMMRRAFATEAGREEKILARTPMHRIGEPEDIGNAAAFLCSPAAKFITGAELVVDGGMSIGF